MNGGGVVHSFVKSNDSGLYGIVTTTTTTSNEQKKKKDYIVHYDLLHQKQNPIIELDSFPSSSGGGGGGGVVIRDYLVYCCFSNCLKVYDTRQPSTGKLAAVVLECGFTGSLPPLTCLDVDCNYNLAVGTEMVKDDAFVRVYDVRSLSSHNQYKMEFTESFSNDLSQLEFYRGFLLTSSTDGLSCLFDLNSNTAKNLEEDDYLVRVFNSDAAVYRFGVYCDEYLYTMSHQNTVQLFNMNSGSRMFDCSCNGSAVINTEAVGSDLIVYTQQSLENDKQYSVRVNRCTLENGLEKVLEFQSDAYVNDAKIVGKDLLLVVGATDDGIRVFSHQH